MMTFAGEFRRLEDEAEGIRQGYLSGCIDRSSDLSRWVPAPGFPGDPGWSDRCWVVINDPTKKVMVVATAANCMDAGWSFWIIRGRRRQWRCLGVFSPDNPRGIGIPRDFELQAHGLRFTFSEFSREFGESEGERFLPFDQSGFPDWMTFFSQEHFLGEREFLRQDRRRRKEGAVTLPTPPSVEEEEDE